MWSILPSSGFLFLITRSLKVVPGGSTLLLQWFYLSYSISCLCSYFCSGVLSFSLFYLVCILIWSFLAISEDTGFHFLRRSFIFTDLECFLYLYFFLLTGN